MWRSPWSSIGTTIWGSKWGTTRELSWNLQGYKRDINPGYLQGTFLEIHMGINLGLYPGINWGNNEGTT